MTRLPVFHSQLVGFSVFLIAVVAIVAAAGCRKGQHADLVLVNARIWTGAAGNDDATTLAVAGGRFVAVGDTEELIGPRTVLVDAGGRRVIPGMTDSHTHIVNAGLMMSQLPLREVADRREFIEAIAKAASEAGDGEWILGGRWSTESWPDATPPTRAWVDPVAGGHPLFLSRMDGHQALANSVALRLAGIDRTGPPDPPGGDIVRDPATHEPTGILKDSAMDLVSRHIPPPSALEQYDALRKAMTYLNSLGVTSVHDMSGPSHLEMFQKAHERDELSVRIHSFLSVDHWRDYDKTVCDFPIDDERLRVAGFKGYVDGSLGSRNAHMHEPYHDAEPSDPYPRGQLTALADPWEHFRDEITWADRRGFQMALHAIGDEANQRALNAYEYAVRQNGSYDRRHRIEHVQHLLPEDIPRFGALGVVASMQPFHKADDARYAEKAIGRKRAETSYAYRQLLDEGALLAFGSDWPVVTCNPFEGMAVACTGQTVDGDTWMTAQNITVAEALSAYTSQAAKAGHQESVCGTIEPGKVADFVILDRDILDEPEEMIGTCTVWRTYFDGRQVYGRE